MAERKAWRFRGGGSDSDSDSDSDNSSNSSTNSSSDSSSDSDSSSSSSSSSSSEQATGLEAWLKPGGGAQEAKDRGGEGNNRGVKSKQDKATEKLDTLKGQIENHISIKDASKLADDLTALVTLVSKMQGATPPQFISCVKGLEEFVADQKDAAKKKDKLQAKVFNQLRQKVRKLAADHREAIDKYESEVDESSSSTTWDPEADSSDEEVEKKPKKKAPKKEQKDKKEEEQKDQWDEEGVEKKLEQVKADRGRKATRKEQLIDRLKVILGHSHQWKHLTLCVLSTMLSCQLDRDATESTRVKKDDAGQWRAAYDTLTRIFNLIQENPELVAIDRDEAVARVERGSKLDAAEYSPGGAYEKDGSGFRVNLSVSIHEVVEILGDQYIKALQEADAHTHEYIARLTDECYLVDLCERAFCYYKQNPAKRAIAASMGLRLLDHLTYRRTEDHVLMLSKQRQLTFDKTKRTRADEPEEVVGATELTEEEKAAEKKKEEELTDEAAKALAAQTMFALDIRNKMNKYLCISDDLPDVVKTLHRFVQKYAQDERHKTKALLLYVYHLAVHDKYSKARDLLIMSRRHAEHEEHMRFVNSTDLMILYNRGIAQLGLAAFRAGEFYDTNTILNELCATNKTREVLAQDKTEKKRLVPPHMHINTDTLEGAHLIAAMLHDVPIKAQWPHDQKRRPLSKALNRLLVNLAQQVFLGTPETNKELVYAAYQSLQKGDWEKTNSLVMSMPFWQYIQNPEKTKKMVQEQIKMVGLRTYLFTYSQYYATVQLEELAVKYELDESKVHAAISKMILKGHMTAAWDQPQQCICVEHNGITKLQFLAQSLCDKCTMLVEYNEQRQAEKDARQSTRDGGGYQGYQHNRRRMNRWDNRGSNTHRLGIQKSREVERKKESNPFEQKSWKRGGK